MAIGDLTAEEQTLQALINAEIALLNPIISREVRGLLLAEIREAIKRVQEARNV